MPKGLSLNISKKIIEQMKSIWKFYKNDQNGNIFEPENIDFLKHVMDNIDSRLFNNNLIENYNACIIILSSKIKPENSLAAEEEQIKLYELWIFLQVAITCFLVFQYDKSNVYSHHFNQVVWGKLYWNKMFEIFEFTDVNYRTYLSLHKQVILKIINVGLLFKQKQVNILKLIEQLLYFLEAVLVQMITRKKKLAKEDFHKAFYLISIRRQNSVLRDKTQNQKYKIKIQSIPQLKLITESILSIMQEVNWREICTLVKNYSLYELQFVKARRYCLSHLIMFQDKELLVAFQRIAFHFTETKIQ